MSMLDQLERLEPPEPMVTHNVSTEAGFTERFTADAIELMLILNLIKMDKSTHFPDGKIIVFYVRA